MCHLQNKTKFQTHLHILKCFWNSAEFDAILSLFLRLFTISMFRVARISPVAEVWDLRHDCAWGTRPGGRQQKKKDILKLKSINIILQILYILQKLHNLMLSHRSPFSVPQHFTIIPFLYIYIYIYIYTPKLLHFKLHYIDYATMPEFFYAEMFVKSYAYHIHAYTCFKIVFIFIIYIYIYLVIYLFS